MSEPRSIGVRELRQNASVYLRAVQEGASFQVTSDGEPVALLVPIPRDPYQRLVQDGTITPPADPGSWARREPLPAEPGRPSLGDLLRDLRAEER
jgi:prevent-host-death family protein